MKQIAEISHAIGQTYLSVAGIAVVLEGQTCFDGDLPRELYKRPAHVPEGAPFNYEWTLPMLEYVRDRINGARSDEPELRYPISKSVIYDQFGRGMASRIQTHDPQFPKLADESVHFRAGWEAGGAEYDRIINAYIASLGDKVPETI